MKIYSDHITESHVRLAFFNARRHDADIYIEDDNLRTWKPRRYAYGTEVFGESVNGKRRSQHGRRAASWHDWGYVIAVLFRIDPDAKIGFYDGKADFIAKVTQYRRPGASLAFLDVLTDTPAPDVSSVPDTPAPDVSSVPDPIVFGPVY